MNAVVFFVFCFSILPERKKNKLFCCIFITALVNDHFRPCRKIDAENLTPPKKKEEKSQLACGTAVLSYSFIFIHTLSLSKNNDSAFVTGSLLSMTTHSPEDGKYKKRRLTFFPGWLSSFSTSLSSSLYLSPSSRDGTISLTELTCVLGAFIVLACYASQSSPSSVALGGSFGSNLSGVRQPLSSFRSRAADERSSSTSSFTSPSPSALSVRLRKNSLSYHSDKKNYPRIAAALTTSKRPELFRRAYLSFRLRCLECDEMVSQWFAVDDGSSDEQLEAMETVSSDITWLSKYGRNQTTGHVSSLNRVLEEVVDHFDYLVFLEDDFFFIQDENYISKALNIFAQNQSIGQVVFNRRYSLTNTEIEDRYQIGGIEVRDPATGNVSYILHEYIGPAGSPEWKAYFEKHPGIGSVHWPHFSLNSGVWKLKALKEVGRFEKRDEFEFAYGSRWMAKGYVTAFFPGKYSIHLGKPLPNSAISSEVLDAMFAGQGLRHSVAQTASAYDLNGVIR